MTKIPNMFLVGMPKSGSTSLARWLGDHPEISLGVEKETKFLLDADNPRRKEASFHNTGVEGYAEMFANLPEDHGHRYLFDATPTYYDQETALRIVPQLAEAPVIFLLREPVARLLSGFHFLKNNEGKLPVDMGLGAFVADRSEMARRHAAPPDLGAVPPLHYAAYLRAWQKVLGADRIEVIFTAEMEADPRRVLTAYATRIGIDPAFYDSYDFPRMRQTQAVGSHDLHRRLLALKQANRRVFELFRPLKPLYAFFNYRRDRPKLQSADEEVIADLRRQARVYDAELADLLGRRLPWQKE
jgi:hypothetical protein